MLTEMVSSANGLAVCGQTSARDQRTPCQGSTGVQPFQPFQSTTMRMTVHCCPGTSQLLIPALPRIHLAPGESPPFWWDVGSPSPAFEHTPTFRPTRSIPNTTTTNPTHRKTEPRPVPSDAAPLVCGGCPRGCRIHRWSNSLVIIIGAVSGGIVLVMAMALVRQRAQNETRRLPPVAPANNPAFDEPQYSAMNYEEVGNVVHPRARAPQYDAVAFGHDQCAELGTHSTASNA